MKCKKKITAVIFSEKEIFNCIELFVNYEFGEISLFGKSNFAGL